MGMFFHEKENWGEEELRCCVCRAALTFADLEFLKPWTVQLPHCQTCLTKMMRDGGPKDWREYEQQRARERWQSQTEEKNMATFEPTDPNKKEPKELLDKSAPVPLTQLEVGMIAAALCAVNMGEKGEELTERYFQAYQKRLLGVED